MESYDVEVAGLDEMNIGFYLPEDVMEYYQNFGGIDSSDFMYNLYKPEQLISLSQSQWSFVKENFAMLKCNRTLYLPKAPATTRFRTMKFL